MTDEATEGTDERTEEEKQKTTPITTEEQDSAPSEQGEQGGPTIMRVIETPMEDEERLGIGTQLAELMGLIDALEEEKKASNKRFNDNIGVKQGDAHKLAEKYLAAVNTSERECPVEYNWETNVKLIKHPDTGDTLHEDVINDAERQKFMPGFENQVEEEPEGELMPCATDACDDELDGNCTKPDGDISCSGYKAPEVDDSEEHETLTEGEPATA